MHDGLRRIAQRLARDEDGIALVFALMACSVLALTTSALVLSSAANQSSASQSAQAKQAFALAQLSLAYAEGEVYSAARNHGTPAEGVQSLPAAAAHGKGSGAYGTSVAGDGHTWTMTGTGTVGNVIRTVSAKAYVPGAATTTDAGVWNYLYADSTATHSCSNSWDTLSGGTTVSVPILTRGDLCITGGSHFTGSQLEVGGKLTVQGGSNVGTSSTKITKLNVGGSPSTSACSNNGTAVTPGTSVCDGNHSAIYAQSVGTSLSVTPQMPSVDFQTAYDTQATAAKSGCPAGLFDNDAVLNDSVSNVATTLFEYSYYPTALSFDCHVGSYELKWQQTSTGSSAGTLTVNGTFYFDGSLTVGSGQSIQYTGQGSLYFTGGVTFGGGSSFCGIANCTSLWNPDQNGVIFVARCWKNSTGSSLIDPKCVYVTGGAKVQFGAYAATNYTIDGGTSNMGPVLANTLTVSGGSSTLVPFHTMPVGTPLNTTTNYLPADPPSGWSG